MVSNILSKAERFAAKTFTRAGKPTDVYHAQRTVHWIKQLKPDADEALAVAGALHDIERAFYGDWKKGSTSQEDLQKHQDLSSSEAEKFLKSQQAGEALINKVKLLIAMHEVGGDEEQSILCDADCLAYFEEKALRHAEEAKQNGEEAEMIKKLDFNFKRFSAPRAREIARPFYEKAMNVLN
ncbi:MAG: DUF4202 family protein [bacterium]|nr:DUF4202 family protein [bacterium]